MTEHPSDFMRPCREPAAVLLVMLVALMMPALSFPQSSPASEVQVPALQPDTLPRTTPEAVSPPMVPPLDNPMPEPETTSSPPREPTTLAIVLPLGSPTYGAAAEAVRAGFAAAAERAKEKVTVIAHGDGGARSAFDVASDIGSRVVVGPLLRDDVRTIATTAGDGPWTIALNQYEDSAPPSNRIYILALSIENEGRQLARRMQKEGAQNVGVVADEAPLQKRFASAFIAEWILLGGSRPSWFNFGRSPELLTLLRREIGRAHLDAMLIATDADEAALAKPYIGQLPCYTSSQVNDRVTRSARRDLDDIFFVEIPWLADPGSLVFADVPRREFGSTALDRLYALGIDAFHVAQVFAYGPPERLEFDGATGHLSLDATSRQFMREGIVLQFRDGEIVAAGAR